MTQAEQLVKALRRGWHSYGDLEALRVSTCPWKRLSEAAWRYLRNGEYVQRKLVNGLVHLRITRVRKEA